MVEGEVNLPTEKILQQKEKDVNGLYARCASISGVYYLSYLHCCSIVVLHISLFLLVLIDKQIADSNDTVENRKFLFRFSNLMLQYERIYDIIYKNRVDIGGINLSGAYEITYNKLWKLLIDRNMKKKDLQTAAHISSAVIAKMGRGESVTLETLAKICCILHCNLADIVDIIQKGDSSICQTSPEKL